MSTTPINRNEVIQAIKKVRQEWQKEVDTSLAETTVNLGVFLVDLTDAFGLSQAETRLALGAPLLHDVDLMVKYSNDWVLIEEQPVQ